jgi:hypothetical protein
MKDLKYYWFIILGFIIGSFLVFMIKSSSMTPTPIDKNQLDVKEMKNNRDSLFILADSVANKVSEMKEANKSKINDLDLKVKNKEITINQQVSSLEFLVKSSETYKKSTDDQVDSLKSDITELDEHNKSLVKENKILKETIKEKVNLNLSIKSDIDSLRNCLALEIKKYDSLSNLSLDKIRSNDSIVEAGYKKSSKRVSRR